MGAGHQDGGLVGGGGALLGPGHPFRLHGSRRLGAAQGGLDDHQGG